ncbi:MAG: copper oxidase [Chloroflexota bacterium]|nr:copper oxidase [Chloroflexota bacterium]
MFLLTLPLYLKRLPVKATLVAISMATAALLVAACQPAGASPSAALDTVQLSGLKVSLGGTGPVKPTGKLKEFTLVARQAQWELLPGLTTTADTFNGTVPGPTIRVTEGDTVRVVLRNELPQPTSVHWHGLHVPNAMDGVAGVTQKAVEPGESFTYEFTASHAGTFMYHSHGPFSREQIDRGLYGTLIIEPQKPEQPKFDREYTLALQGWMVGQDMSDMAMSMDYNYFTINGKSFPATEPLKVKTGDVVRLRLINPSQTIHPMHLHGQDFKIVAKDGEPLPFQQVANTVVLNQGETYDIVFIANNPGRWVFHCHDLHHASNDGVEPGGLIVVVEYEDFQAPDLSGGPVATPTPMPTNMPGMGH